MTTQKWSKYLTDEFIEIVPQWLDKISKMSMEDLEIQEQNITCRCRTVLRDLYRIASHVTRKKIVNGPFREMMKAEIQRYVGEIKKLESDASDLEKKDPDSKQALGLRREAYFCDARMMYLKDFCDYHVETNI
jgi:hypothetical protein